MLSTNDNIIIQLSPKNISKHSNIGPKGPRFDNLYVFINKKKIILLLLRWNTVSCISAERLYVIIVDKNVLYLA